MGYHNSNVVNRLSVNGKPHKKVKLHLRKMPVNNSILFQDPFAKTEQIAQFMAKIMHVPRNSENGPHTNVLTFAGFVLVM